jgi:uncharacterized membrane protein
MNSAAATPTRIIHSVLLSKSRVEALTDGIFAIAMTLLVLDLKIPELHKPVESSALMAAIAGEKSVFFSFLLSFLYCGLLWLLHHLAMHFIRQLQTALVWLNLLFLMSISILPFSCALLGHYMQTMAAQEIYFGNLLLAAVLLNAQWLVARKKKLILDSDPTAAHVMGQRLMMFPPALAAAMLAAMWQPWAGFYAMLVVMLGIRIWNRQRFQQQHARAASASAAKR